LLPSAAAPLLLLAAVAASPSPSGPTFSGTVRFQGRPAPQASVWLVGSPDEGWQPELAASRADDQGRFTLPIKSGARWVVARNAGGRLGWLMLHSWEDIAWEPALRVELFETGEARGKLLGPDGKPLHGRVRVAYLLPPAGSPPERANDWLGPPAAFAPEWETDLVDDGGFVLRSVPLRSKVGAVLEGAGYKDLRVQWDQQQPLDLRLAKPGTVRLRFTGAADPKQLAGLSFTLRRKTDSGQDLSNGIAVWGPVKAGPDPTLRLDGLYPGAYELEPSWESGVPLAVRAPASFQVKAGQETEVAVAVQPQAHVEGRVIDRATGKGIPGVGMYLNAPGERGASTLLGWMKTDEAGRFRAYVQPGKVGFSLSRVPAGHLAPREAPQETHTVAAGASATFTPVALGPAVPVEGVVQDGEGRPIAGVRIVCAHQQPFGFDDEPVYTDRAGRFTLRNLGPKDFTALRARTAAAVTDGAVAVDVAHLQGPVKLVLSEANVFRLRGRVLDNVGRPVADAAVQLEWQYRGAGRAAAYGFGARLGTYRTDADGRFETQALWPGDQYTVQVSAPGYGRAESAQVSDKAGKRHDLGTITLPRTAVTVAGVVVDRAGKPVAGATVFNQGDGPAPVQTTTDAAGRFKLQGLYDGPVCVFVRRPGYRFTLARASAGDASVTVRLLKAGELPPAAEQPDPRPPEYVAAERKLTRHLLERLWALPRSVTGGYERTVFQAMAGVDLARAKQWLAEEAKRDPAAAGPNSRMSRTLRAAEADKAAADDPDEALALLAPLPADSAYEALLRLARRYEKDDPAKARRFVEEAVVKARALPLPDRAWSLAQAGDLAVRLGQRASGRKLLTEAADLADHFGTEQTQGSARGRVATLLAPYDLARSRALIRGFTDTSNWNYWHAEVAVRRAPADLPGALALLDELRPDNSFIRDESRLRIAYRLAEKDPAEAVKQAEAVSDMGYRATALSGVAALIARREPARALIDRTLGLYLDRPEQFMSWSNFGGRTTFAAWTAYDARLAGYPDMASVVARVLATRPTTAQGFASPREVTDTLLQAAMPLSFCDPVTARRLVEQALPGNRLASDDGDRRTLLFAVALADPERAVGLVDHLIDQARKSKEGVSGTSLIELMLTLTAATEQLRARELGTWIHSLKPRGED
jgi:protocatechuate 3,4-dioxygenase beta subunit